VTGRHQLEAMRRNLPERWAHLFAYVPGRSARIRCLLCGATGHGSVFDGLDFAGRRYVPAPWMIPHIVGHPVRCETCRRPFTERLALSGHQNCTLHHSCCLHHTSVPEWKNPFRSEVAS
jgi:hypothetical protein